MEKSDVLVQVFLPIILTNMSVGVALVEGGLAPSAALAPVV